MRGADCCWRVPKGTLCGYSTNTVTYRVAHEGAKGYLEIPLCMKHSGMLTKRMWHVVPLTADARPPWLRDDQ